MIFKVSAVMLLMLAAAANEDPGGAASIDSILQHRYQAEGIRPLPACDDLQFLRRVTLDLAGRIPTPDEIRQFQRNPDRSQLVDRLLESPEFSRFLSEAWTAWLIGYSNAFQTDRELFRMWLQSQIDDQVSFQEIVRQMISARGSVAIHGPANYLVRHRDQPAVNVTRSFLGVRLECAQCHDHPFDRWTQEDYRRMSQFFSGMRLSQRSGAVVVQDAVVKPGPNNRPIFLTGSTPRTSQFRDELALYVTSCKPFARNFANRIWYQLMGRGIVDPPDDHNQENREVDAQLYQYLTQFVVDHDFQIKPLFRLICNSQAYSRCSGRGDTDTLSLSLFAARTVKPLLPEQYIDSFAIATGQNFSPRQRRQLMTRLVGYGGLTEDIQRPWDYRETVQQLMEKVAVELPADSGQNTWRQYAQQTLGQHDVRETINELAGPQAAKQREIENLYLRILTRLPTAQQSQLCRERSPADITFALIFGNEFYFSH